MTTTIWFPFVLKDMLHEVMSYLIAVITNENIHLTIIGLLFCHLLMGHLSIRDTCLCLQNKLLAFHISIGTIHKRHRQLGGGRGQNWSKLTTDSTKKLPTWGRGCQKSGKIANVVYGWSLNAYVYQFIFSDVRTRHLCGS